MAAQLEPCRAMVWYAAHAFSDIPEESTMMASHTKAHLSEVGRFVTRTATEVHGGMGFTDLIGLHYWFKRCGFNRQILGSPDLRERAPCSSLSWQKLDNILKLFGPQIKKVSPVIKLALNPGFFEHDFGFLWAMPS